jgi:C-terminal peptidase prc
MNVTAEKTFLISRSTLVWSLAIMALMVVVAGGMAVYVLSDPGLQDAITLRRAALYLADVYPADLNTESIIARGREAMFGQLDRYSTYVSVPEMQQRQQELTGGYQGIGVTVVSHDFGLLVMSVRENGPAAEAAVLPGDVIVRADSVSLAGLPITAASSLLRGPEGTEVQLGIFRETTDDTTTVTIRRRRIELLHIPFAGYTQDSILYLRLLDFQAGAADDVRAALDSLVTEAARPRAMILDLRGNPGGLMNEAFETANLFLEEGAFIVGTDGRSHWNEYAWYARGRQRAPQVPMAVLVDRGSASAAEIVAGALRYNDRAILVGDTTFGKGLVQGFWEFPGGDGLRLTTSRYYFAGGVFLNDFDTMLSHTGRGLVPDHMIRVDDGGRFGREIDNSLLLQRFVGLHLDDLVDAWQADSLDHVWVERFAMFAYGEGFSYESPVTAAVEQFSSVAAVEQADVSLATIASRLGDSSRLLDNQLWFLYADHILDRLERAVVERHLGMYETYRRIIVPRRSDIRLAAGLLLHKDRPGET